MATSSSHTHSRHDDANVQVMPSRGASLPSGSYMSQVESTLLVGVASSQAVTIDAESVARAARAANAATEWTSVSHVPVISCLTAASSLERASSLVSVDASTVSDTELTSSSRDRSSTPAGSQESESHSSAASTSSSNSSCQQPVRPQFVAFAPQWQPNTQSSSSQPTVGILRNRCDGREECKRFGCTCATERTTAREQFTPSSLGGDDPILSASTASAASSSSDALVSSRGRRAVRWKRGAAINDAAEYESNSPSSPSPFNFTRLERLAKRREWRAEFAEIHAAATAIEAGGGAAAADDARRGDTDEAMQTERNIQLAVINSAKTVPNLNPRRHIKATPTRRDVAAEASLTAPTAAADFAQELQSEQMSTSSDLAAIRQLTALTAQSLTASSSDSRSVDVVSSTPAHAATVRHIPPPPPPPSSLGAITWLGSASLRCINESATQIAALATNDALRIRTAPQGATASDARAATPTSLLYAPPHPAVVSSGSRPQMPAAVNQRPAARTASRRNASTPHPSATRSLNELAASMAASSHESSLASGFVGPGRLLLQQEVTRPSAKSTRPPHNANQPPMRRSSQLDPAKGISSRRTSSCEEVDAPASRKKSRTDDTLTANSSNATRHNVSRVNARAAVDSRDMRAKEGRPGSASSAPASSSPIPAVASSSASSYPKLHLPTSVLDPRRLSPVQMVPAALVTQTSTMPVAKPAARKSNSEPAHSEPTQTPAAAAMKEADSAAHVAPPTEHSTLTENSIRRTPLGRLCCMWCRIILPPHCNGFEHILSREHRDIAATSGTAATINMPHAPPTTAPFTSADNQWRQPADSSVPPLRVPVATSSSVKSGSSFMGSRERDALQDTAAPTSSVHDGAHLTAIMPLASMSAVDVAIVDAYLPYLQERLDVSGHRVRRCASSACGHVTFDGTFWLRHARAHFIQVHPRENLAIQGEIARRTRVADEEANAARASQTGAARPFTNQLAATHLMRVPHTPAASYLHAGGSVAGSPGPVPVLSLQQILQWMPLTSSWRCRSCQLDFPRDASDAHMAAHARAHRTQPSQAMRQLSPVTIKRLSHIDDRVTPSLTHAVGGDVARTVNWHATSAAPLMQPHAFTPIASPFATASPFSMPTPLFDPAHRWTQS